MLNAIVESLGCWLKVYIYFFYATIIYIPIPIANYIYIWHILYLFFIRVNNDKDRCHYPVPLTYLFTILNSIIMYILTLLLNVVGMMPLLFTVYCL